MRILITGGAGYIGSVMTEFFLRKGLQVKVLDNLMYGQSSLAHLSGSRNFDFFHGDIRDISLLKSLLADCEVIVPLAGIVGAPACAKDEKLATEVNLLAPLEMFRLISKNQCIIMPTTNSAYGTTEGLVECDEKSPLSPISKYAKDKVKLEENLMELNNAVSFRLATVFGVSNRMRLDLLVNNFVYRAFTDKYLTLFESSFVRNYIHVKDVISAFDLALKDPSSFKGEIFNVGLSDANLTKLELAQKIKGHVPELVILESQTGTDPDKRNYRVSNRKLESRGYVPEFSIDDGIQEISKAIPFFKRPLFSNV